MGVDFYKFLATCKKSEKPNTYSSNEAVHSQTAGRESTRQIEDGHFIE